MLSSMIYSLPELLEVAFTAKLASLESEKLVERIWSKDASVWTDSDEAKWLGWLTVAEEELTDIDKYRELKEGIDKAFFKEVLLMGMGGSSLCPEVLALTFGKGNFHILDSTVPSQVKAVEEKLDLANTLF